MLKLELEFCFKFDVGVLSLIFKVVNNDATSISTKKLSR